MRSLKRDHKAANVDFEIVKHIVDDCSTNIFFFKVDQKVQKWLSYGILKLAVEKTAF